VVVVNKWDRLEARQRRKIEGELARKLPFLPTAAVNRALQDAVAHSPPPMHKRRPMRLKFAHQAGKNPPTVVVHGNLAGHLSPTYRRYLAAHFARAFRLTGAPVRIITRTAENPYAPARKKRAGRGKK